MNVTSIPSYSICVSPYHKGQRWLPCSYFYVSHTRNRLQSYCITCGKISQRTKNLSESAKDYRRNYSRQIKEKQRRDKGIPSRGPQLLTPRYDSEKLYEYLQKWLTEAPTDDNRTRTLLNGIPLSQADARYLNRVKNRDHKRLDPEPVDALATKYDLPYWELAEAAACYKKDTRSVKRDRAKVRASRERPHSNAPDPN